MKWYQKTPAIILLLIFFFPVGIFLMWKYTNWKQWVKIVITILLILAGISAFSQQKAASQPANAPAASSSTPVSSSSAPTVSSSTPAESKTTTSSKASSKEMSKNMLLNQMVVELPVKNGLGTDTIGTYGYIQFDKDLMKDMITEDDFIELYESKIKDKGYNYFTIAFGDETGIVFPGGGNLIVSYGIINENRMITETLGNIVFDGEHYTYESK